MVVSPLTPFWSRDVGLLRLYMYELWSLIGEKSMDGLQLQLQLQPQPCRAAEELVHSLPTELGLSHLRKVGYPFLKGLLVGHMG